MRARAFSSAMATYALLTLCLALEGCSMGRKSRLLAVGGIHAIAAPGRCRFAKSEPQGAVVMTAPSSPDLILEAKGEGTAVVICGSDRVHFVAQVPTRLVLSVVDGSEPRSLRTGKRYDVVTELYDASGRSLEVGEYTPLSWSFSGVVEEAPDPSAAEFGFRGTGYFGMNAFRCREPGEGTVKARLGEMQGVLRVKAISDDGKKPGFPLSH